MTGITGISKSFYDKKLCLTAYEGKTPEGLGIGSPWNDVTDKAGKPDSVLTSPILTSRLLIYNNIVYFVDTRSQTVDHILVRDPNVPLDLSFGR